MKPWFTKELKSFLILTAIIYAILVAHEVGKTKGHNKGYAAGQLDAMIPAGVTAHHAKSASLEDVKDAMDKAKPGDVVFIGPGMGIMWQNQIKEAKP